VFFLAMMVGRNRPAALIAASIYAFHPYIARAGSRILSEIPFNALYLSALILLIAYWRSRSLKHLCLSALFLGLSVLTRPSTVLFPALIVLLLFLDGRRERTPWLGRAFLYCMVTGLVILPWTIRCSLAFKTFIPISTAGGYPLWSGAGPGSHGEIVICPPYVPDVNKKILKMNEIQADHYLTQEAKKLIRARPMHWLYLDTTKFFTLWFRMFRDGSTSASGILTSLVSLAILVLAWFGARMSGDRRLMQLMIGMFAYFSLMHMATYAELRYVIGAYSYMMPFAGIAVVHLLDALRTRIRPRAGNYA
jgi:4-amino-4-deoxy-L-arabinose transferase-like glycosyltransferase